MNRLQCLAVAMAMALPRLTLAQPTDAVSVDPDVHRVIYENEHVRVFDARAAVGTRSPMHSHPPTVLITLGTARVRISLPDGTVTMFDTNPGQVLWLEGARHSWEMVAGNLHAIGVEIKSAQEGGTVPPGPKRAPNDPVAVDPDVHHLLFENPHVRVFEGRASHGQRSPMHKHQPALLVALDWLRLKLTLPDGKTVLHDFHPGDVLWTDGGEHSWEALAGSARVIGIEVKSAAVPPAG